MEMQAVLLSPIASGIVVSLTSVVMKLLSKFGTLLDKFMSGMGEGGVFGAAGSKAFESLININDMMSPSIFQLIVGIYMIEVVGMLAIFLTVIRYGEDNVIKKYNLGKKLLIASLIYSVILIFIYLLFNAVLGLVDIESMI
jgi:hypothetical protein